MRITNKLALAPFIFEAMEEVLSKHDRGDSDVTVTELLEPPRKRVLTRDYEDQIQEDISDLVAAFIGVSVHKAILSKVKNPVGRLYMKLGGITLSGELDYYDPITQTLHEIKTTKVAKLSKGIPSEFIAQINAYAHLLRANGREVERGELTILFTDWSKIRADKVPSFRQSPALSIPISLWGSEKTNDFLLQRIEAYKQAHLNLPECTEEETWQKKRCEYYCNVSKWCVQSKAINQLAEVDITTQVIKTLELMHAGMTVSQMRESVKRLVK